MYYKNIIFLNQAHYGDVFVSRSFVKEICEFFPDSAYTYFHKYKPNYLFKDIKLKEEFLENNLTITCDYFIDTWYAAKQHKYFKDTACTIQTLYKLFTDVYSDLKIPLQSIEKYIPEVDFSKYNFLYEKRNKDYILVCNNIPLSGQSSTTDMTPLIELMAKKFTNKKIFITNETSHDLKYPNIVYTKDILKNNNLMEISWFSTQCGAIIGRASGPYTFSILKRNFNDGILFVEITNPNHLANFGLQFLGYNNFLNVDCKESWDDIFKKIIVRIDEQ